jgi:hypothetical protein
MRLNSSVSKVSGYRLDDWVSILGRGTDFCFYHHAQTSFGAHWTCYPMVLGAGSFSRDKAVLSMKLTVLLHLMLLLINGTLSTLPHMSSWYGP